MGMGRAEVPADTATLSARPSWIKRERGPYWWLAPAILLVAFVSVYPLVHVLTLSFTDAQYFMLGEFIGLGNYAYLFGNVRFRINLVNTVVFTFGSIILQFAFGFGLALLLSQPIRLRVLFRAIIVSTWVISEVVIAVVWRWMLNPQFGMVDLLLQRWGITEQPLNVLGSPEWAMPTLILASFWRGTGFFMVMMLAALQGIPETYVRAMQMDRASRWDIFRHLTIPFTRHVMMVSLIIATISVLNLTALPLAMTGGGPLYATEVLSLRLYKDAFDSYATGTASAIATILFVINIGISLAYVKFLKAESYH